MTREEADAIAARAVRGGGVPSSQFVQILVDLGVLKLDEPKAALEESEIIDRLLSACHGVPYLATCIHETIAKAGLKIVEK